MKYIRVKNAGKIEVSALHMMGVSTKRGDSTKIGQFGSGNRGRRTKVNLECHSMFSN